MFASIAMVAMMIRAALIAFLACAAVSSSMAQPSQDPPSVVAWLGHTQGDVSFSPAGTDTWAYATPNRPLTTGDQLWVERGGRAELHVGSTALRLGHESELSFTALDDDDMRWRLSRGSLQLRIRAIDPGQRIEVNAPHLAFVPTSPGSYRIDVDPDSGATRVTTWSGEGRVYGDNGISETIPARASVVYGGEDFRREEESQNPVPDAFDRWAQARDDQESRSASARYVSREMTGYAALDGQGTWSSDPAYGTVWIPTAVASNWAPYHYGHWAWIDPWGWTWVDDAPWGFAPFHYGRWAWLPARAHWAWVPGRMVAARPVYAPALVAFVSGGSGGTRWGVSLGNGAPGVAWLPLAPGEAYRPGYRVSPHYVTRINQTIVVRGRSPNMANVYMNQHAPHAIAAVPSSAFVQGQRIRGTEGRVPMDVFRHAHFEHAIPLAPTAQSRMGEARIAPPHAGAPRPEPVPHAQSRRDARGPTWGRPTGAVPAEHAATPPTARRDMRPDVRPDMRPPMRSGPAPEEAPRPPAAVHARPASPQQDGPRIAPRPPSSISPVDRFERGGRDQATAQPEPSRVSPPAAHEQERHTRMRPPQPRPEEATPIRQRPDLWQMPAQAPQQAQQARQQAPAPPEHPPQPQPQEPRAHAHEPRAPQQPGPSTAPVQAEQAQPTHGHPGHRPHREDDQGR